MPERSLFNTFSLEGTSVFLYLEILHSTSVLYMGTSLDREIINRKHKNIKNVALHSHEKDIYLYYES